jgi:4-hydroxybenzoate polyprenyltransferase
VVVYLFYIPIIFSYGYLINSFADRDKDNIVGKDFFYNLSRRFIVVLLTILLILALLIPLYFEDMRIMAIVILGLTLASVYSLEPIRLKERGILGVFSSSVAQALPILFFVFLMPISFYLTIYLFIWIFLLSTVLLFNHQIDDILNDLKSKTRTFTTVWGREKSENIAIVVKLILFLYIIPSFFYGGVVTVVMLVVTYFSVYLLQEKETFLRDIMSLSGVRNDIKIIDRLLGSVGAIMKARTPNLYDYVKKFIR